MKEIVFNSSEVLSQILLAKVSELYPYVSTRAKTFLYINQLDKNVSKSDNRHLYRYDNNKSYKYIGDIVQMKHQKLLCIPLVGPKTRQSLYDCLRSLGLDFDVQITDWLDHDLDELSEKHALCIKNIVQKNSNIYLR